MRRILAILFFCKLMGSHAWTCAAQEGIPATDEQLNSGIKGFKDYARMYCKRCGQESEVSRKFREA